MNNVEWQNGEMFTCGVQRHHVLRRTDNQYLTIQSSPRGMFYIWRRDIRGHMWIESKNGMLKRILEQWDKVLAELPRLEFGDNGFFVNGGGSSVLAGTVVRLTPQIRYSEETLDNWLVRVHHCNSEYLTRFPVYGKQRIQFMDMHARLDEPMGIRFDKWEFQACQCTR